MMTEMDEIRITGLEIFAHHGVYKEETRHGQNFIVNAVLYVDTRNAGVHDALEESVDYGAVSLFISEWMKNNTCKLLESVANRLAEAILLQFSLIHSVDLEICKPEAPIPLSFENVSVKIRRGWHKAYIAFGSNMGDRAKYIDDALLALRNKETIRVGKVSGILETEPYGVTDQGKFLNGVLEADTLLSPEELLIFLHEVENAADRKRILRWGPRTLDLDILFYDKLVYESDTLIIPHVDMENRTFVLKPLAEIAPNLRHPVFGKTVAQLLRALEQAQ